MPKAMKAMKVMKAKKAMKVMKSRAKKSRSGPSGWLSWRENNAYNDDLTTQISKDDSEADTHNEYIEQLLFQKEDVYSRWLYVLYNSRVDESDESC